MLTDEQIKEEARKKIENMSPEEREKMEQFINDKIDIDLMVRQKGLQGLTKEENRKFHSMHAESLRRRYAGTIYDEATEKTVMEHLHLSREEIATLEKNPFKAGMGKKIACAAVAALAAAFTGAFGLTIPAVLLSGLSGYFSLRFGEKIVQAMRFRDLQKKYNDPTYQQEQIDAEVYNTFEEEITKERGL